MSDADSRHEDAKREAWEAAHADEIDRLCPDCGRATVDLDQGASYRATRLEPGCNVWECRDCGYYAEQVSH